MTRPETRFAQLATLWLGALLGTTGCAALIMPDAAIEPAAAGPDFLLQGEYSAAQTPVGAQVVARGDGEFLLALWSGGLPGHGYDGASRTELHGERRGDAVSFTGDGANATLRAGRLTGTTGAGEAFDLVRVERESPTLGAPPPGGAFVVFAGPGANGMAGPGANGTAGPAASGSAGTGTEGVEGRVDSRGLLQAGATSKRTFRDAHIHLEFRTPFEPTGRGQLRGNSGVYLQNRYEIQVLDSFGLTGEWNECGGIYRIAKPMQNMAFPPLRWQTYDIEFRAARYAANGEKVEPARVSVRHNGVEIHRDRVLPGASLGGESEGPEPGPLYLQDHWNPVVYRNVWILPIDAP